jgi:MFS family permease
MTDISRPAEATDSASKRIALTVAAAFFMETLDATVIVTALPAIGAGFGIGALDASLAVTVYLIAMAALVPAAGWCAGRFGARRVFALAVGTFTVASLLCGLAPTFERAGGGARAAGRGGGVHCSARRWAG